MADAIDLVVPNIAEFNLRNPALRLDPVVERGFAAVGAKLADQAVFWTDEPRVLVLPAGLDRLWFADVHDVLGLDQPPVVSPIERTGLLLADLLRDGAALGTLLTITAGYRTVRIRCWGVTPEIYQLAAVVRSAGTEVELDGPAEEGYWASLYLESKQSCVDLAARLPGLRVPYGITVANWAELDGALPAVLAQHGRAIVKSLHGVGGEGSTVVRAGVGLDGFWLTANRDPFLRTFPLIVQAYVEHATDVGCPAVDLLVTGAGVATVVLSVMTVDVHRVRAVSVGNGSVPAVLAGPLRELGTTVGLAAAELGYRGWLCVDCVYGRDGALYVTELNARRSGAMHSIALLRRWTGQPDGDAAGTHSDDSVPVRTRTGHGGRACYRNDIRPLFQRLWTDGVRALPTTVRGLDQPRQEIAVLAAADTAGAARQVVAGIRAEVTHGK